MSTCRCGSTDELKYVDGKFVDSDGQPHICDITNPNTDTDKVPSISIKLEKIGIDVSSEMFGLKLVINENIKQFEINPNQGMIWEMTQKAYAKYEASKK